MGVKAIRLALAVCTHLAVRDGHRCGRGRVGVGEHRLTGSVSVEFGLLPSSDMCFSFPVEPFQKVLAGQSRCLFAVFLHYLLAMD